MGRSSDVASLVESLDFFRTQCHVIDAHVVHVGTDAARLILAANSPGVVAVHGLNVGRLGAGLELAVDVELDVALADLLLDGSSCGHEVPLSIRQKCLSRDRRGRATDPETRDIFHECQARVVDVAAKVNGKNESWEVSLLDMES